MLLAWFHLGKGIVFYHLKGMTYGENKYRGMNGSIHAEEDAIRKMERKYTDKVGKKNKKKFNLIVIKVSRNGENIGMSRLCEQCVLRVYNLSSTSGIKIKYIFYSDESGNIIKSTPSKLFNSKDQHITSYLKNRGYKSILNSSSDSDESYDSDG